MADRTPLSELELSNILGGISSAAETESVPPAIEPDPLRPMEFQENDPRFNSGDASFLSQFARRDEAGVPIPFDVNTGAGLGARFASGLTSDAETKQDILKQAFSSAEGIERIPGGNFIIRGMLDPETGQRKDLLFDERSASSKDLFDISNTLLQVLGGAAGVALVRNPAGARAGAGLGATVGTMLGQAVLGTAGARVSENISEVTAGIAGKQTLGEIGSRVLPESPGSLTSSIGSELALDIGLQAIPFGLGRTIDRFAAGSRGTAQREAVEAIGRIKEQTGISIPLSLGESTGRPLIQRAEAIAEKTPVGGALRRGFLRQQDERVQDVQRWMLGGELPPRIAINNRALNAIQNKVDLSDERILRQNIDDTVEASQAVKRMIDEATPRASGSLYDSEVGLGVRRSVAQTHQVFQDQSDRLFAPVLAEKPKFSIKAIKQQVSEIRSDFSKETIPEVTEEVATGLVDLQGKAITKSVTKGGGREVITELIPDGLKTKLAGLDKLDDLAPLRELRSLRTDIYQSINSGLILGDVPTRRLQELATSITKVIDDGAAALPSGKLKIDLDRANDFYSSNIKRFQTKGITELLADPTQSSLGNIAVVDRALNDPDQYLRLKRAMTDELTGLPGNAAREASLTSFDNLKKIMLSNMVDGSLTGSTVFSVKNFAKKIDNLKPEIANDLIGEPARRALQQASNRGLLDTDVPVNKLMSLLKKPNVTSNDITQLMKVSVKENQLYKNAIIRKLVKGKAEASEVGDIIRSDEFVDKFIDAGSIDEVAEVMNIVKQADPKLHEDIKRLTIQKTFKDAQRVTEAEDLARILDQSPTRVFNPSALAKTLDDPTKRSKLDALLGTDTMNLMVDLARVESARKVKQDTAKAVGGLIAGSLLNNMLTKPLSAFPTHLKYALVSSTLANPVTRAIVERSRLGAANSVAKSLVASAPFLEALVADYGIDSAEQISFQLQRAIDESPEGAERVQAVGDAVNTGLQDLHNLLQ
jgi:hypothetical protein